MGLFDKISHDTRLALGSIFLIVNAVTWVYLAGHFLVDNVGEVSSNFNIVQLVWTVNFVTLAICLIAGTMLTNKVGKSRFLLLWTLLGVFSPLLLLVLDFKSVPVALLISGLFAASIGLGMPCCMEYFAQSTKSGRRGTYAGFILLTSSLALFFLRLVGGGIELTAIILAVWRLFGLLGTIAVKPFKENVEKKVDVPYRSVIQQRSFILYIAPWLMFSLINFLSIPVQQTILPASTVTFLQIIEDAVAGIAAIGGGFLLDYVGRKQAAISGFVMLGLSYSLLGLYPKEMISWYFYTLFDGISWGILTILFVLIIWSELNPNAQSDKYYALGVLPFFFSQFLSNTLPNYIVLGISSYALFSFIAFFLFVAVLPLLYAPETLPEKIMKDRELKRYIEKAMKKAQHEAKKNGKNEKEDSEDGVEFKVVPSNEKDDEYEKAKQLAEKYY